MFILFDAYETNSKINSSSIVAALSGGYAVWIL